MINVSSWSIRNPIPAVMLFVLLTVAGFIAFGSMKVQNFPDLDVPTISVTASLPVSHPMTPVWESGLEEEALALLNAGQTDVWDVLTRRFETSLIQAALATTRGRRIEAAQKLGIGRNTITRKIQELGIDD